MEIRQIHSFLVHPGKSLDEQPELFGAKVPLRGRLYDMLAELFANSEAECDIDILFRVPSGAAQDNECRTLFVEYVKDPNIGNGRLIAQRLQSHTTRRSNLGLLFTILGSEASNHQLVVARFPADQGVVAQERSKSLDIQFIERVFMKSAFAYKAALYTGRHFKSDFWTGKAVDKQINTSRELSQYWIGAFLDSDFATTAAAGTKRLAIALRDAIKTNSSQDTKGELIAAAKLLPGKNGRSVSPESLAQDLGLSDSASTALQAAFPRPDLFTETFQFDAQEYGRHVVYRTISLDNGATVAAPLETFDKAFDVETSADGAVQFRTKGRVVNQQLRKAN